MDHLHGSYERVARSHQARAAEEATKVTSDGRKSP